MPKPEVEPLNSASSRPAKGTMTWIGLAAIIAFVVILAFVVLRPAVDRSDGPEPGPSSVNPAAVTEASE